MSTKRWVFFGLALVMVLSLLPVISTQLKGATLPPQAQEPLQSSIAGPGFVSSLWELIDYWEGQVQLQDLVGPEGDIYIQRALGVLEEAPELQELIEIEIVALNLTSVEPVAALTPDGLVVVIVQIPAIPVAEDSKAAITVVLPEDGSAPLLVMGYITNILMIDQYGAVVVQPSFLIRSWWWIDGRIVWWHYWWYDSSNHPNWYYSWWYWYYRYYEYYGYGWYEWYTWYYSWFYWYNWYYWSTWWAF